MADAFLGSLKIVAFPFAPRGWALCNGAQMPIAQNQPLFSILGPTYGGDGVSTFNLPDLRGRVPLHQGQSPAGTFHFIGEQAGSEQVTLSAATMPTHIHLVNATTTANNSGTSVGGHFAAGASAYATASDGSVMAADAVGPGVGTALPVDIRQPFVAMNYIIALQGMFPTQY